MVTLEDPTREAPTLVVTPNPPFLYNANTQWNPQLEMNGVTDEGTQWEARYSVNNDGAVMGSLEGEIRRSHEVYGDFTISRWMHEAGGGAPGVHPRTPHGQRAPQLVPSV